jgi:peptidoglycan/LPS O-acetylase OafA/YrhL
MPEPVRSGQRYLPGLDGLRAVAVLAVIAYHLGLGWARGGLLGVGVFFTLSGYLITDLLLGQFHAGGRLQLADFWMRRARRLLPALFVMLPVVVAWVTLLHRGQLAELRAAVFATCGYVSNWWLIAHHVSYFARFGPPSPLGHLWSLAVEEQFYLIWPWLLLLGLRLVAERDVRLALRPRLAGITLLLAAASAVAMAVLYRPGFDMSRVYDGTDTRAFGLLIGAALAMVWPSRVLRPRVARQARRMMDGAAVVALGVIALLIWRSNEYSPGIYRGGLVLLSLATAVVVAVAAHPATATGRVLGWSGLRWLGVRSYGIYLWHFPVIVLTSPHGTAAPGLVRMIFQVAASVGLAAVSWRYVEEPIRHGALGRFWAARRSRPWHGAVRGWRWAGVAAVVAVLATACVGMTAAISPVASNSLAAPTRRPAQVTSAPTPGPTAAAAGRTSCAAVTHIGDSTSEGMISADYLPNPAERLDAQYARVGATSQHLEISGARSIVETLSGQVNAYEVAHRLITGGYRGCWVLALGTNDTANVYVGSTVDQSSRVDRMMSLVGNAPVLWVNVTSLLPSGPYAASHMRAWNDALERSCAKYPNLRVLNWAAVARPEWFIADGIHYTSAGNAARARAIADGLARAFPAGSSSASTCVVP